MTQQQSKETAWRFIGEEERMHNGTNGTSCNVKKARKVRSEDATMWRKTCGKPKHCRCERGNVSRSSTSTKDDGNGEATSNMKYAYSHWFDYFSSEVFISAAGGRHGVSSVSTNRSRRYPNTYRALSFASFLPKGAQELVWCQTWINLEGKKGKNKIHSYKT